MKYIIAMLCLLLVVVAGCTTATTAADEPVIDAPSEEEDAEPIEEVGDLFVEEDDSIEIGELI